MLKWFSLLGRGTVALITLGCKKLVLGHHLRRIAKKEERSIKAFENAVIAQGKALRSRGYLSKQSLKHLTLHLAEELRMDKCQLRKVHVEQIGNEYFIDIDYQLYRRDLSHILIV
ncbi:hypothetical protein NFI00_000030 [Salmonella enterica]|nr:hypothetical protein [Salmonella enterica]